MFITMNGFGIGHKLLYTDDDKTRKHLEDSYEACSAAYITNQHQAATAKRRFVTKLVSGILVLVCAVLSLLAIPESHAENGALLFTVAFVLVLMGVAFLQGIASRPPSDYDRLRHELEGTIQNLLRSGDLVDLSMAKQLIGNPAMQQAAESRPVQFNSLLKRSRMIVTQRLLAEADRSDKDYRNYRTRLIAAQDQAVAEIHDWLRATLPAS